MKRTKIVLFTFGLFLVTTSVEAELRPDSVVTEKKAGTKKACQNIELKQLIHRLSEIENRVKN